MAMSTLQCAICLDDYNDPIMLPCQHCFCFDCIIKTEPFCPLCKKPFRLNEFIRNLKLEQILDETCEASNKPKPSNEFFPTNFELCNHPEFRQQNVQNDENNWFENNGFFPRNFEPRGQPGPPPPNVHNEGNDWLPALIAAGAGLLVGTLGMKAIFGAKRKK